jgi:hypothetical protein
MYVQISRIQLSFGIVPLQEADSSYNVSTGLVVQPFSIIFIFFFQMAFFITLFQELPFWFFLSDWCYAHCQP